MVNIYVGNLSYQATDDELRQAFEQFGEVAKVSVIMDRETGRARGFAFVEMPNADQAQAAIEGLNSKPIAGRPVTVNEARPKEERPRSAGGGGFGAPRGGGSGGGGGGRRW